MRRAQIGLGEHGEDRFVGLLAGEIDLAHQAADQARRREAAAAVGGRQRGAIESAAPRLSALSTARLRSRQNAALARSPVSGSSAPRASSEASMRLSRRAKLWRRM